MKTLLKFISLGLMVAALVTTSMANHHKDKSWKYYEKDPAKKICFAIYTLHDRTLKMTTQFYPLADGESRTAELQVKHGDAWKTVAKAIVSELPYNNKQKDLRWTAHFRVENWDDRQAHDYRVVGLDGVATYEGKIRRDPVDKKEIVVAAFTGNSSKDRRMKPDLIANLKAQDPDLLFFSGDQVYDHTEHLDAWLLFGRQFGEIMKDRPTICIPDDHDVGNGNLWGNGGKPTREGYRNPTYVKSVEYAQTSNLPDPYDPTPIARGIGVYYTSLKIGKVDFAIVEDRKFKSAYTVLDKEALRKKGVVMVRHDHVKVPPPDPKDIDVPDAPLLGKRQLKFLEDWNSNWSGVNMKCVLSQTIFAGGAHIHRGQRLAMDLDSNGWPQSGRNRAVQTIRKSHAFHIAGDQHLATVIHHGVDGWEDAMVSFCTPSIVNFYPRKWMPEKLDGKRFKSPLQHTGQYFDGFGNRLSMMAYVNPDEARANKYGKEWGEKADGHAIVRFNVEDRTITMECWPRGVDVTQPGAPQYPGWPITIKQEDNYARKAFAYLRPIHVTGIKNPLVQVLREPQGELVYAIRIKGQHFTPKVFEAGTYTLRVGEGENIKEFKGLKPEAKGDQIEVKFE
ncbi:MAG: metallophosphoesterase [Verrucomicrobiae bacterium]|nr:metallophosphoesterase [Verrucomicrobiae bacterium]NNJ86282.1 metallophosphoesterase [Akkermansiaceae bacterium]